MPRGKNVGIAFQNRYNKRDTSRFADVEFGKRVAKTSDREYNKP
jgi:hypothetical protein